ncbi:MAG: DNA-processing protein DprA [Alphaproteobacteria bacterium]
MTFPAFSMQHKSLAGEKLVDALRLIRTQNVGPVTFFQLIRRFGTAANALKALPELSLRGGRSNALVAYDASEAEKEIALAEKFGARFIMYGAADYPAILHAIPDAPPIITMLGHAQLWKKDCVGVVGARNASAAGCQFAAKLAKDLGDAGITVVSGLARGIDSFAHKGSLVSGTVGVIAGGIDNIYPPENAPLYAQLRESGAIISEQPFGLAPFAGSFPGRNRIIAGMSLGSVIVEAAPKSGSLITARLALEYNREVFAVPGSPLDPRSKGGNQLLKQGAIMVEAASDILQGISHLRNAALGETPKTLFDGVTQSTPTDESELQTARRTILEKLSVTPVSMDELATQCNLPPTIILTVLLELELAGKLRRSAGGKVATTLQYENS